MGNPLKARLKEIQKVIKQKSPHPKEVQILAVTKKRTLDEVKLALKAGITLLGENTLKEAEEKFKNWKGRKKFQLHMVGILQSNKVRRALEIFDCIQSVAGYKVAERINRIAGELDRKMPIYIQVNLTGDSSRHGLNPDILATNLPPILTLPNLDVQGLMLVAPKEAPTEKLREAFQKTRELAQKFNLKHISAGMSNDFSLALEEGTHLIRLGSALFGPRN